MFAKIENNTVVEYPISNLAQRFPNSSICLDDLPEGIVRVHPASMPACDHAHRLIEGAPEFNGQEWHQAWSVAPLAEPELALIEAATATTIRSDRSSRLAACDWTQVADAPVDQAAWAAYRQLLREVTKQPGFPWSVQWPNEPTK